MDPLCCITKFPRALLVGLIPLALGGCIVAPCPKNYQCKATEASGGGGQSGAGQSGAGQSGAGGGSASGSGGRGAVFTGTWVDVTGNLSTLNSECGNMSYLTAKPDEDLLIAGVALNGLWGSSNGGDSWTPLGGADGGALITNRTSSIVYDPIDPRQFWESGIYHDPAGVYQTSDNGEFFSQLGKIWHIDAVSIDFTDPARQTLLAGGHEQPQTVWRSTDGGKNWLTVGEPLPANKNCTRPLVIDSKTYLVGCGEFNNSTEIHRTTDGGATWTLVDSHGGASTPLIASDGSIYWGAGNPIGIVRSVDQGAHWTAPTGTSLLSAVSPIELPDGRIASFGSKAVVVSSDHGVTWTPATAPLPYPNPTGVVYSKYRKAFYVWTFSCVAALPPNAIMRYDLDEQKD